MSNYRLAERVKVEIRRATGRQYRIALHGLDEQSLRELLRLLQDLEAEQRAAARRAQLTPWRRP